MDEHPFHWESVGRQRLSRGDIRDALGLKETYFQEENRSERLLLAAGLEMDASLPRLKADDFLHPERLCPFLPEYQRVQPESVIRPSGNTTLFTSAGVQRLETTGTLAEPVQYVVPQPVIRSQFMDTAREGYSSAFVNFCAVKTAATHDDYLDTCRSFLRLIAHAGWEAVDLTFSITETIDERWGDKLFSNIALTTEANGVELGECVYIHDYPAEEAITGVLDLGFSLERMRWALCPAHPYFSEFADLYEAARNMTANPTALFDSIRSQTLIAAADVRPSNHNHGYRFRQYSKRLASHLPSAYSSELDSMVARSLEYWEHTGWTRSQLPAETLLERIRSEYERNLNARALAVLKKNGQNIGVSINQPHESFLRQLRATGASDSSLSIIEKNV